MLLTLVYKRDCDLQERGVVDISLRCKYIYRNSAYSVCTSF